MDGNIPINPDAYQWGYIDNNLQGVNIDVVNTEIKPIVIQQNNAKLTLNTLNHPYPFTKVEIKFGEEDWVTVSEETTYSVGWLDFPDSFQTFGQIHSLKVRYEKLEESFFREYEVIVVPASSAFYRDNTKTSEPFTTGNTLTVWETPNQNEEAQPMLIIEGYDVANSNYAEFYRAGGNYLANELFALNYDIYILNFSLGAANIRENAAVLHSAIEYISSLNDGGEVAVMGLSMGGLIARYALAKAEEDGSPLPASSFTSIDSPQQGAVVDSEFQDWIKDKIPSFSRLDNSAAKEMLIYNAFDEDSTHELFYDELNSLNGNGYPSTIPTIGIAFSNNTPNPNLDQEWLKVDIDLLNDQHFHVKEEWAQSGSILPISTTMIDPIKRAILGVGIDASFDRRSDPTFIPYESALDIVDGESKFCFTIELPEGSSSNFHDEIPDNLVDQFILLFQIQEISQIATNEVYNFTQSRGSYLLEDLTVFGEMHINASDNFSGSSLDPKAANPTNNYKLSTSPCESLEITVENNANLLIGKDSGQKGDLIIRDNSSINVKTGGELDIKGDSKLILKSGAVAEISGMLRAEFGGQVIIKDGASLRVTDGGTLRMIHSSNLVVEEGGLLIIEDGANIDLWDNTNHRAHISVTGELVINGQLSIGGSGYFKFNKGNKITFGPNLSEFVFTGNSQTHRFFLIGEDATLAFGEMPFRLSNGIIEYEAGSTISAENAPYAKLLAVSLNGLSGSGTAISTSKVEEVDLQYCRFSDLEFGLNSLNEGIGTVLIRGCNFSRCQFGLFSNKHQRVDIYSSNFSGEGLEKGMATFLTDNQHVSMTSTEILDFNGPAYQSDYDAAISLGSDQGITNLSMYGCLVQNNYIGITAAEGTNTFSDGNIFLRDRTTFQDNETGIYMVRGRHQELNAGLVLLDCARLIDNGVGVRGTDVLLQADAEENCLECGDNPQIQIRPNTLIAPWPFDGPANIFDICYQEFEVTEVPAKGNYWDGVFPSDVPFDQMWRFTRSANCSGFVDDNILDASNFIPFPPAGCPTETIGTGCPPDLDCIINPPDDKVVIVGIEGINYNVHSQYAAAYQDFRNENLTRSRERFMPIAGIPDEVKVSLSGVGKHYIDVARVMVNALQDENQAGLNSEGSYSDTYSDLWLPGAKESVQVDITEKVDFTVYPNPANDQVLIETTPSSYELSVYDILGSLVHRTTINGRTKLEVAHWQKGLYTIELKELDNLENSMIQKLIIQ